jgi:hypothetical protein
MQSIEEILKRNNRVEQDKAWEVSYTRRAIIAGVTYVVAALFMYRIGVPDFFLNAAIPTGGYLLSTLSLPWIKRLWLRYRQIETHD